MNGPRVAKLQCKDTLSEKRADLPGPTSNWRQRPVCVGLAWISLQACPEDRPVSREPWKDVISCISTQPGSSDGAFCTLFQRPKDHDLWITWTLCLLHPSSSWSHLCLSSFGDINAALPLLGSQSYLSTHYLSIQHNSIPGTCRAWPVPPFC